MKRAIAVSSASRLLIVFLCPAFRIYCIPTITWIYSEQPFGVRESPSFFSLSLSLVLYVAHTMELMALPFMCKLKHVALQARENLCPCEPAFTSIKHSMYYIAQRQVLLDKCVSSTQCSSGGGYPRRQGRSQRGRGRGERVTTPPFPLLNFFFSGIA